MAIYFIEMEGLNLLKIGFTERDPKDRLRELQTANPHKLNLLHVMDGGLNQEAELHQSFDHLREQGEWFRFTPELQAFLAVSRFVAPRLSALTKQVNLCRERLEWLTDKIQGGGPGDAKPWTLDQFAESVRLGDKIDGIAEQVDRLIEKVEMGNPDAPPAWQGEIDDLRGLIQARINR